jgi:hypothetical protein
MNKMYKWGNLTAGAGLFLGGTLLVLAESEDDARAQAIKAFKEDPSRFEPCETLEEFEHELAVPPTSETLFIAEAQSGH